MGDRTLIRDDSGQATTEYILMLTVGVALALLLIKDVIVPLGNRIAELVSQNMEKSLSKNLHRIRLRR